MGGEVYVNVRGSGQYTFVTVCDVEILGRTLREGKFVLEIREEFYGGRRMSVEDAMKIVKQYHMANLIGERAVGRAVEEGLVHKDAILRVEGVPHAMIIKTQF